MNTLKQLATRAYNTAVNPVGAVVDGIVDGVKSLAKPFTNKKAAGDGGSEESLGIVSVAIKLLILVVCIGLIVTVLIWAVKEFNESLGKAQDFTNKIKGQIPTNIK